jgi:putative aldouronate transport system permease protein
MKRLDRSELIFKIIAYSFVTLFALAALYPFIYTLSAALSSKAAFERGAVVFLPVDFQLDAMIAVISEKGFWNAYTNTLFYTFFGTVFSMALSIAAAYALSKDRLVFRRQINFIIVFTMWFSAGLIPTFLNYRMFGVDFRWGIVWGFGVQAFNVILLRNYFSGVSKEIEEAAIVDGANEFQVLTNVYLPMSKSAIATVTLFYALSRWNGYFWNLILVNNNIEHPLQVFLRRYLTDFLSDENASITDLPYSPYSYMYAMIVMSIIPIIIVYPYLQKYFARGVNVGGVKE